MLLCLPSAAVGRNQKPFSRQDAKNAKEERRIEGRDGKPSNLYDLGVFARDITASRCFYVLWCSGLTSSLHFSMVTASQ